MAKFKKTASKKTTAKTAASQAEAERLSKSLS